MKDPKAVPINSIEAIEILAQKRPGWNARRDLPAMISLEGGCDVHVVPAWLWQPRIKPRVERFDTQPTPMPRRIGGAG
jgi:hypothetical protein